MREMTIDEMKAVGVELLKYLHQVCVENEIRYYVAYGTLIGTIRHQGYIPWDDDIDCELPLEDLMRLKEIVNADYEAGKTSYKVLTMGDPHYYLVQGRLVDTRTTMINKLYTKHQIEGNGVYIDLFILTGLPAGRELKYATKLYDYRRAIRDFGYIRKRKNVIMWLRQHYLYFYYRYFKGEETLLKKDVYDVMRKYPYDEAAMVYSFGTLYLEKAIFPRSVYEKTLELPFEGFTVHAPAGYDLYLTQIYGDYMTPLKPEERASHHLVVAYWKD